MKLDPQKQWPALAAIAAMFAGAALLWPAAPARLPIHWNAAGRIDGYGGKFAALLSMPIIAAAVYALVELGTRLRADRLDAPTLRALGWFKYAILSVMTGVYAVMAAASRGIVVNMNYAIWPLMGILLMAAASLVACAVRGKMVKRERSADDPGN